MQTKAEYRVAILGTNIIPKKHAKDLDNLTLTELKDIYHNGVLPS